jgi:hypothetical protein
MIVFKGTNDALAEDFVGDVTIFGFVGQRLVKGEKAFGVGHCGITHDD